MSGRCDMEMCSMWNGAFCICAVLDISPLDRMEVEKEMQVRETGRVRLGLPSGDPASKDRSSSDQGPTS